MKLVIYDKTEKSFPLPLSLPWGVGARVLSGADICIAVGSCDEAYTRVASILQKLPEEDRRIDFQAWGHGFQGAPQIRGETLKISRLANAMVLAKPGSTCWWRMCDVHEGRAGHAFARSVAEHGFVSVGHCTVISWPNPFYQGEICALRPGEDVWWSESGSELSGCSTFRMNIPKSAFQEHYKKAA